MVMVVMLGRDGLRLASALVEAFGALKKRILGCQASFGHATFGDEIWKTICNLEFRRWILENRIFSIFGDLIAALVKTAIFLVILGFFTRNLM